MKTATDLRVEFRDLSRHHLPSVLSIARQSLLYPWTEAEYCKALNHPEGDGVVALASGLVAGFAVYRFRPPDIRLDQFAVAPWCPRRGVGRRMAGQLTALVRADAFRSIALHVRESNDAGIAFWRAMGFRGVKVARGHFGGEDGYLMRYSLMEREHVTLGEVCS